MSDARALRETTKRLRVSQSMLALLWVCAAMRLDSLLGGLAS